MGVARDVLYLTAPRVQEEEPISVFVMVGAKDASMKDVVRAHKAVPTSARHMVEANAALGDNPVQITVTKQLHPVIVLLGERLVFVLPTVL